ncbi:hypothetical protein BAE44_0009165, partial [Dichanthelium oligosanthes]
LPFKFQSISAKWETLCADDLNIDPDEFREALFYYSAIFDMLDATIPRDNDPHMVVERYLIGWCALNVIAYEGSDRVERPETSGRCETTRQDLDYLQAFPVCPHITYEGSCSSLGVSNRSPHPLPSPSGAHLLPAYEEGVRKPRIQQPPLLARLGGGAEGVRWRCRAAAAARFRNQYHKDIVIDIDCQWLLQGWKGLILYAMSTWIADDAISEL